MSTQRNHLTDEELDDCLIGTADSAAAGHLTGCPECRAQIAGFQAHVDSFNRASLGWAQARSNALPSAPVPRANGWRLIPATAFATAALALGLGFALHPATPKAPAAEMAALTPGSAAAPIERTRQIADDNALLAEIDTALARPIVNDANMNDANMKDAAARPAGGDVAEEKAR